MLGGRESGPESTEFLIRKVGGNRDSQESRVESRRQELRLITRNERLGLGLGARSMRLLELGVRVERLITRRAQASQEASRTREQGEKSRGEGSTSLN